MTDTITIVTIDGTITVEGSRWTRSESTGAVYVYDDESETADPVAEVAGDTFVAAYDADHGNLTDT